MKILIFLKFFHFPSLKAKNNWRTVIKINPFHPKGQLMAPKLIILMKCLIDILFF